MRTTSKVMVWDRYTCKSASIPMKCLRDGLLRKDETLPRGFGQARVEECIA
jgi:hypothetical protein